MGDQKKLKAPRRVLDIHARSDVIQYQLCKLFHTIALIQRWQKLTLMLRPKMLDFMAAFKKIVMHFAMFLGILTMKLWEQVKSTKKNPKNKKNQRPLLRGTVKPHSVLCFLCN